MAPVLPGYKVWEYWTPLLVSASPLLSPWIDTTGFTILLPWFVFAGGTSVFSIDGSLDGSTADADFNYAAPTSGTPVTVISPFLRFHVVQSASDATKSKIFLQARA